MYTVYLTRAVESDSQDYLAFIADDEDSIVPYTLLKTSRYAEALRHAGIMFELYARIFPDNREQVACHIESPFGSEFIASYTVGSFYCRKTTEKDYYMKLIDQYESLLTRTSPRAAIDIVAREHSLSSVDIAQLNWYLSIRPKRGE